MKKKKHDQVICRTHVHIPECRWHTKIFNNRGNQMTILRTIQLSYWQNLENGNNNYWNSNDGRATLLHYQIHFSEGHSFVIFIQKPQKH